MPVTTPPTITAQPPPPDPNNRATFNGLAYPWSVSQQTFATEVAAVADNVFDNATDAAASATTASSASAGAVAAANYKGAWSSLTGALAIPASVTHADAAWMLVSSVADVTAHEPGVSAQWLRTTAEPASPPGLTLLSTITASGATTVDIETGFSSSHDDYLIIASEVTGSVNSATISAWFKQGGAYISSGCSFSTFLLSSNSTAIQSIARAPGNGANALHCISGNLSGTTQKANIEISLIGINSSAIKVVSFKSVITDGVAVFNTFGVGSANNTSVISGVRIAPASGTISGVFRLYGIAKG